MIAATCIRTLMDWFNDNAGAITAIATVVLAIVTTIYVLVTRSIVRHTASQAAQMKKQADLLEKRDADRARQAIVAIVEELCANDEEPGRGISRYFLDTAYGQGLWALSESPMSQPTKSAITVAYRLIRLTNAANMTQGTKNNDETRRYAGSASEAIHKALGGIAADGDLKAYLGPRFVESVQFVDSPSPKN